MPTITGSKMQLSFQIERAKNYRVYDTITKKPDPYIEKAVYLDEYSLKLIFRNGNINHIDFKRFLKKSKNSIWKMDVYCGIMTWNLVRNLYTIIQFKTDKNHLN
jgi:hypothetical protein